MSTPEERTRVRRFRISLFSFSLLLVAALLVASQLQPGGRPILKVTGVDPIAYFGTARSLLYDGDFDLRNEFEALKPLRNRWNDTVPETGLPSSPFPVGFSLIQLPFMALAGIAEHFLDGQATGYSSKSVFAWFFGILFYLGVGFQLMFTLLRHIGSQVVGTPAARVDRAAFAFTLLLWVSTTLGFYSVSPMAHVAAFAATSAMLWSWWTARTSTALVPWLRFGLAAGVMVLCRWQDILLLILPTLVELRMLMLGKLNARTPGYWKSRAIALAAFTLLMVPQLLQWHQIYGRWITIPQGAGFLSFPPEHIVQVLFSSHHGWLVWTPIAAFGMVGLLALARHIPAFALASVVAVTAEVTLVGSVSTWHGDLFGMRYLTSLVPLLGMGLMGLWLTQRHVIQRAALGTALAACSVFTLLFAVQYRLDLIPANDRLTLDEVLHDKVHLQQARTRHREALAAREALEEGEPLLAWNRAEQAADRWGESRELLEVAEQALDTLGGQDRAHVLEERRKRYQTALLY